MKSDCLQSNKIQMDQVRWGIIGCGSVTEVKSGPAFNLISNSRILAVMRRDVKKAVDYAKRHGVPKWYSDAQNLINDPEINAVYIATPPDSHAEYAIKSMEAGKPVYVEKPMAHNHQECKVMLEVSKKTGIPLFVAYYRRTLPGFLKVKDWIKSVVNELLGKGKCPSTDISAARTSWVMDEILKDYYSLKPN